MAAPSVTSCQSGTGGAKMARIQFSGQAFGKIALHAAKYPHCCVAGLLLAGAPGELLDALPLFHHSQQLAPMAELALAQVDNLAAPAGLKLAGYYVASDNFDINSLDRMPGSRIADKIAELYPFAYFVVIDNQKFSMEPDASTLKVYQCHDSKWVLKDLHNIFIDEAVVDCVSRLLKNGAYKYLIDFDNHLDDISLDWTNNIINKQIEQLISMQ